MNSSVFLFTDSLQPVEEQLKDVTIQIEALTNFPEQVFVYESELTISGMVRSLQAKQQALLEHKRLIDEFDVSGQVFPGTHAVANV